MFKPLKGIKIVDLTSVLAGPYSTYQLGLLGAEIIKIENLNDGDWTRISGKDLELIKKKMGITYLIQNSEKKSIQLNLKSKKGIKIVHDLIKNADIFVENMRPGKAKKLDLHWEKICKINKKIIYCSISAYGQFGPFSKRGAYDHVVQGMCGIMTTTGSKKSGPSKVGAAYIDYATGLNAAFAITSALHQVKITNKPIRLDVSMLDTSLILMSNMITEYLNSGSIPGKMGNEAQSGSPTSGLYKTKTTYLMLAANTENQFHKLCKALNTISNFSKEKWICSKTRSKKRIQLRNEFQKIFIKKSAEELEKILNKFEVPSSKVRSIPEVLQETHTIKRNLWNKIKISKLNKNYLVPSIGFHVNNKTIKPLSPPPILGEQTIEILKSLGFNEKSILKLQKENIIK